jgi:hypothetical protein
MLRSVVHADVNAISRAKWSFICPHQAEGLLTRLLTRYILCSTKRGKLDLFPKGRRPQEQAGVVRLEDDENDVNKVKLAKLL